MLKKILIALLVVLGLNTSTLQAESSAPSFEGQDWKLVSFGSKGMAVPKNAWIHFENGRYSGNAGCNGMGGSYTLDGNKITLSQGMSTLMACDDMSLETKIRALMSKVTSYVLKDKQLILMHDNHAILNFIQK